VRKREIIHLIGWFLHGLAEVTTLLFFCVAVYFFLCLIAM